MTFLSWTRPRPGRWRCRWCSSSRCLRSALPFLLLGGRRTDAFGHLVGCATVVGSFICSLWLFVAILGRDAEDRQISLTLWTWFSAGDWTVELGLLYDPLSALFLLLITGVGGLIHIYSIGYMEHDERRRRFFAYLNLFVASMLDAGPRLRLRRCLPGLGGRRPHVVPADRVLAVQALGGGRRQEGVRDQPRRRHRTLPRHRPDLRHLRHHVVREGLRADRRRLARA